MPVLINLQTLIDEQKCYEIIRQLRWSEGVTCGKCDSKHVVKRGFDETQPGIAPRCGKKSATTPQKLSLCLAFRHFD